MKLFSIMSFLIAFVSITAHASDYSNVLRQQVIDCLANKARMMGIDSVVVEIHSLPRSKDLEKTDLVIHINSESVAAPRGTCTVPFDIIQHDKVLSHLFVSARVRTFEKILLLKNRVPKGSEVAPSDYENVLFETTEFIRDELVKNPEYLDHKRAARMLNAGFVLTASMLESIPAVKPNDIVTVIIRSGRVVVSSKGVSKDAGAIGDLITIQPMDSHERIKARIIDAATVEIVEK